LSGIGFVLETYLVNLHWLNSESAILLEGSGAEQQPRTVGTQNS